MKLRLPDNISSIQDLDGLLLELRDYAKKLAQFNILKKVSSKKVEAPEPSTSLKELLRLSEVDNQSDVEELTKIIDRFKIESTTVTVTLAAPASNDTKKQLNNWFRKNISETILINYQFNATILGGLVVRVGSYIYDWSFRRQILANRDKFPEVLRSV